MTYKMDAEDHWEITSQCPEQTQEIGAKIGELLQSGDLILLIGDLGAGKTCLAQGIAWGLGFTDYVASPSFMLVREYQGRLRIYHADFYRLDCELEMADLGLDDALSSDAVCVVEWAEKGLATLPDQYMMIELQHLSETKRQLRMEPKGHRYSDLLRQLKEKWN